VAGGAVVVTTTVVDWRVVDVTPTEPVVDVTSVSTTSTILAGSLSPPPDTASAAPLTSKTAPIGAAIFAHNGQPLYRDTARFITAGLVDDIATAGNGSVRGGATAR
jgi:hypothetical protein